MSKRYRDRIWQLSDIPIVLEELFCRQPQSWTFYEWVRLSAFCDCQASQQHFLEQSLAPQNCAGTRSLFVPPLYETLILW